MLHARAAAMPGVPKHTKRKQRRMSRAVNIRWERHRAAVAAQAQPAVAGGVQGYEQQLAVGTALPHTGPASSDGQALHLPILQQQQHQQQQYAQLLALANTTGVYTFQVPYQQPLLHSAQPWMVPVTAAAALANAHVHAAAAAATAAEARAAEAEVATREAIAAQQRAEASAAAEAARAAAEAEACAAAAASRHAAEEAAAEATARAGAAEAAAAAATARAGAAEAAAAEAAARAEARTAELLAELAALRAAFTAAAGACAAAEPGGCSCGSCRLRIPAHLRPLFKVVLVMLVHDKGVLYPEFWDFLEKTFPKALVLVHVKASVHLTEELPGYDFIIRHQVPEEFRVEAEWGEPSLVEAFLSSVKHGLKHYDAVRCFYAVSGSCVPVEGKRAMEKLMEWGTSGLTMVPHMLQGHTLDAWKAVFRERGGVLAEIADHLIVHQQWVALARKAAQLAVDHMAAILEGTQKIQQAATGRSSSSISSSSAGSGSSTGRCSSLGPLTLPTGETWRLSPDEFFLSLLAKLWEENGGKPFLRHKTVNIGTVVVFPPGPTDAAQLAAALHLPATAAVNAARAEAAAAAAAAGSAAAAAAAETVPEVKQFLGDLQQQDCAVAFANTYAATQWNEAHPITFTTFQGPVLYQGDVRCGVQEYSIANLELLLKEVGFRNATYKTDNVNKRNLIAVLRKVGPMEGAKDLQQFRATIMQMISGVKQAPEPAPAAEPEQGPSRSGRAQRAQHTAGAQRSTRSTSAAVKVNS